MKNSNSTAIIYYTIAIIISGLLSAVIIFQLSWPVSAKIPICLTIFIQLTAMAKSTHNIFEAFDTDSVLDTLSLIKAGLLDSKSGS